MKPLMFSKIEITKFSAFPMVLLVCLILSLTFVLPDVKAQQAQLSLADILVALRSNKATLAERNEILSGAVKERGVTFEITPQIEKELENTGAGKALIEAIKQKSVVVKVTATPLPKPTPTATPIPTPIPTPVEPDFAYYKKQGDENLAKGELDSALMNYNKAIELNAKNPLIYLNRASTFYKKKDYERAITDYDKVIEINPKELIAYSNRANSFEKIGNVEKAVADYKKILELDDKNEAALNNLKRIEDERARELQNQKVQPDKEQIPIKTEFADSSKIIDLGRLSNSMAVEMATPVFSQIAKNLNLQGQVTVQVLIDEEGKVTSAEATEGHRLLRESAEQAARRSKFKPAMIDGKPVKSKGYIVYNFIR